MENVPLPVNGTLLCETTTEPAYRLWSINDRHPAMVRVKSNGVAVAVEVWSVLAAELAWPQAYCFTDFATASNAGLAT